MGCRPVEFGMCGVDLGTALSLQMPFTEWAPRCSDQRRPVEKGFIHDVSDTLRAPEPGQQQIYA